MAKAPEKVLFFSKSEGFHERVTPESLIPMLGDLDLEYEPWLRKFGYRESWKYGHDGGSYVAGYANEGDLDPKWFVDIWDANSGEQVFVEDLASLMTLRMQIAAVGSTASLYEKLCEVHELLQQWIEESK